MSTITKTFTQEEKEAIRLALIKVEKVKKRLDNYIHIIKPRCWWRPDKKRFRVRYQDFREDTLGMYCIRRRYDGTYYFADNGHGYYHIKSLNTLLQFSDTVTMDVEMVKAYLYLLEQIEQERGEV